ncbi:glycerol-3-phosphate 1-O-acyltransferase PlsY [Mycoplasma sp. 6243]|uniref:glycerol-3-phosphate 1-O-acyltransferase PlsY n=1 Tax=Mycoplasma sp. 6243 TaxID=3440865 RepID=UPI003EB86E47
MVAFLSILTNIVFFILGYLVGSLNTTIIIGKKFYKVDVRDYHSGNAGSTNAKRVLGKKAAQIILWIDGLKTLAIVAIAYGITYAINHDITFRLGHQSNFADVSYIIETLYIFPSFAGLGTVIGHIWPIFFGFRGGKGVATILGLATSINIILLPIFVILYFLVIYIWKYVSLGSVLSASITGFFALIPWISTGILGTLNATSDSLFFIVYIIYFVALLFVIYAHYDNFLRIHNKTERKVSFKKNNSK